MSEKKSFPLVQKIIQATNKEQAIEAIHLALEMLHLSTSYTEMISIQDKLISYQKKYKEISDKYTLDVQSYDNLHKIRVELNLLFRDIVDELSSPINKNKILFEEAKSTRRGEAIRNLKGSEVAKELGVKSASALRDIIGVDKSYSEYAAEAAISYSNYKSLESLLTSVRQFIDAIASHEKRELIIMSKDVK